MNKKVPPWIAPEEFGDLGLDHARAQILFNGLQTTIEGLRIEKELLTQDVERLVRTRKLCAKHLREAREKNRKLWLRLDKLAGRGQTDEQASA